MKIQYNYGINQISKIIPGQIWEIRKNAKSKKTNKINIKHK